MNQVRNILVFIFIISITAISCSSRKNKLDRSGLIPRKELTDIITDLYITDGLMTSYSVRQRYTPPDSLAAYRDVIMKHGYTKEAMDKTLRFYIVKRPKKLIQIYDQVLARLSEMDSRFEKEATSQQSKLGNMWRGFEVYASPDTRSDTTLFDINAPALGTFTITFNVTVFPDDMTAKPVFSAYTCNPDSIENGKRYYIKALPYIKDGQPHKYKYQVNVTNESHQHLRGWLYYSENPVTAEGHYIIDGIMFTYGAL